MDFFLGVQLHYAINQSKFMRGFDIKKAIKETLTNDSIIKNNTRSREGYMFEKNVFKNYWNCK